MTRGLIESNQFGFARQWNGTSYDKANRWNGNYNFVEEGLRLGTVLGRKLKVRSEEKSTKYTRKNGGKIDKRLISELGFENSNVFEQTFVDRYNKAYLHISIDASSSMSGNKWIKMCENKILKVDPQLSDFLCESYLIGLRDMEIHKTLVDKQRLIILENDGRVDAKIKELLIDSLRGLDEVHKVCIPEFVTPEQLTKVMTKWLEQNPNKLHESMSSLYFESIRRIFLVKIKNKNCIMVYRSKKTGSTNGSTVCQI